MQIAETIPHEEALSHLKIGDRVSVHLQGQGLNLVITSLEEEIFGKMVNGMMGIDIREAYTFLPYKYFRIDLINGTKVLPPKS